MPSKPRLSPAYKAFVSAHSPEWQRKRQRILNRDKCCKTCGSTSNLDVHHRQYPKWGASVQAFIRQDDDQLIALCRNCHNAVTVSIRQARAEERRKAKGTGAKRKAQKKRVSSKPRK